MATPGIRFAGYLMAGNGGLVRVPKRDPRAHARTGGSHHRGVVVVVVVIVVAVAAVALAVVVVVVVVVASVPLV